MRRVLVLGSTGSIGKQTLEVVQRLPERLQVVGLATYRDYKTLLAQAQAFGVQALGLLEPPSNGTLAAVRYTGVEGLCALVQRDDVDVVVVALGGAIALKPTLAALQAGKTVALATKEVLVAAGEAVMATARQHNAPILPIDSEHSGAFQAMHAGAPRQVARLILTASGGPFRTRPLHTREMLHHTVLERQIARLFPLPQRRPSRRNGLIDKKGSSIQPRIRTGETNNQHACQASKETKGSFHSLTSCVSAVEIIDDARPRAP